MPNLNLLEIDPVRLFGTGTKVGGNTSTDFTYLPTPYQPRITKGGRKYQIELRSPSQGIVRASIGHLCNGC